MNNYKVAIVEDDLSSLELMEYNFLKSGFQTICFSDSVHAFNFLKYNKVDLIVTDWMMPKMNGKELVLSLNNSENKATFKFMVSCKSEENDVIEAFDSGVTDFLPKPLRVKELIVRAKKKLEHLMQEEIIQFDDLVINSTSFEVTYKNQLLPTTKTEFQLLKLLAKNKDKVFSREEILDFLNHGEYFPTARSVDVIISNLRKKLGNIGEVKIKTIHGLGYRLT